MTIKIIVIVLGIFSFYIGGAIIMALLNKRFKFDDEPEVTAAIWPFYIIGIVLVSPILLVRWLVKLINKD